MRVRPACFSSLFSALGAVALLVTTIGCGVEQKDTSPTACAIASDEPNDTEETAADLGELTDYPDSHRSITSSVHTASDEDWYRVHIADRGLGGNPEISVGVPSGFDVTTWFVRDGGHTSTQVCAFGAADYVRVGSVDGCRGKALENQTSPDGSIITFASSATAPRARPASTT